MTGWQEQLDRFAGHLAQQRRAVAEGRLDDVEQFVPHVEGPLPAELARQARALAAQADALAAELGAAAAAAARQLQVVTAMQHRQPPTTAYVDHRA